MTIPVPTDVFERMRDALNAVPNTNCGDFTTYELASELDRIARNTTGAEVTIKFGREGEHVETFNFDNALLRDEFLNGVAAGEGWMEYEIVENDDDHPHQEVLDLILELLAETDEEWLAQCINNCHNGVLRGPINTENLHLFRRYRNDRDAGNPEGHAMIEEARKNSA